MSERLGVQITTGSGQAYRWSADEPDARNVPLSVRFASGIPGGFTSATITLEREITRDFPDLGLYDDVRIYGAGNETAWEGRVAGLPRSHSDSSAVTVQCVGWAAHLRDDASFTEVYVDADLGRWGPASRARKIAALTGNTVKFFDPNVNPDATSGAPGVRLEITGAAAAGDRMRCEAWYDAGPGVQVGDIYYDFQVHNLIAASGIVEVASAADADGTVTDISADLYGSNSAGYFAAAGTNRYGMIRFRTEADTTGEIDRWCFFRAVRVYGEHGLTRQGTDPGGFYASDIVNDVVSRAAPLLEIGSIEASSFVVPHAAFPDPTTAEDVISQVNAYDLYEWGVYEGRKFFFRAPDLNRTVWEARLSSGVDDEGGAEVQLEGPAGDQVYNGVLVSYTDTSGEPKTAGPVGSGADSEDATLEDALATNPVNAHGIPRRWFPLELSTITSSAGAIRLGARWLEEQAQPQRRGQITLRGSVRHPTKGLRPPWAVRAGDSIKIADHSGDVIRRVIEVDYDADSQTATCSLDNSAARLESILERIAAFDSPLRRSPRRTRQSFKGGAR